jgi:hypothetical protein
VQQIGDLLEPRAGDSLRGFFRTFVPWEPAALIFYVAASGVTVVVAAQIWRSAAPFAIRASAMVVATILISPHAFGYDLVLLAPVLLLVSNTLVAEAMAASHIPGAADDAPARSPRGAAGGDEAARQHGVAAWAMRWSLPALFLAPLLTVLPAAIRLEFSVTAMAALLAAAHRLHRSCRPATESLPRERARRSLEAGAA